MGSRRLEAETTAEAYLELLKDRGIDVFLGNAGTDFASLVEAFARFETDSGRAPRPLVVPHEFVAVSMAHGYYQRLEGERPDLDVRREDADHRGGPAGRARPSHPLGPGKLRPGRDAARVRQVGLRAADAGAARVGRGPRVRADARRAARPRVPHAASRSPGRSPRVDDHHVTVAARVSKRALPRSRADR